MMSKKPSNWYTMSYEDQQRWLHDERERQDLEYECDRAREEADQQHRRDARRLEEVIHDLTSQREEINNIYESLNDAQSELELAHQWLKENGHWESFDLWASYRRMS